MLERADALEKKREELGAEAALLKRQASQYLKRVKNVLGEEGVGEVGAARGQRGAPRRSPRLRSKRGAVVTARGVPLPSWNEGIPANRIPKLHQGKYTCQEDGCDFFSSNMDTVRGHFREVHSKVPLKCPCCPAEFWQRQTVANHLTRNICPGK